MSTPDRAGLRARLIVAPEVADAIAAGRPIVALESTLISHGLPWPDNLAVAMASEAAVRESGAVPATIAVRDGRVLVGLGDADLEPLARAASGTVRKVARPSLAAALAAGGWGATTVSATMLAAHAAGITVMATGGIGGVHRGAIGSGTSGPGKSGSGARPATFDISTDLEELAATPMAVVCAGPKAILDVPATLEYLETRGVPVVAVGQDELPGFYARSSGIRAPLSVPDLASAAALTAIHLGLGLGSSVLLCVPVPESDALQDAEVRADIERAIDDSEAAGIAGPELTPWLLARLAELSGGRTVQANRALIINDALVAGRLAVVLANGPAAPVAPPRTEQGDLPA